MSLEELGPTEHFRVIDLAQAAGIDVSPWSNGAGGDTGAPSNPKYAFEWAFIQPGEVLVANLWHDELVVDKGQILRRDNLRIRSANETGLRVGRARRMDEMLLEAHQQGLPVRVILLAGEKRSQGDEETRARMRRLDEAVWAVTHYDYLTGDVAIARNAVPIQNGGPPDDQVAGFEGRKYLKYMWHRQRERRMRNAKIAAAKKANNGRLVCEVKGCGFDFAERYGQLGTDYAQVHHLKPLRDAPDDGRPVAHKDLAVVCANCHVMIHLGGECRELNALISCETQAKPS